jgi:hypothetical protein
MRAKRVAKVLGLSDQETGLLLRRARGRFGSRGLGVRESAFLLATSPVLRSLLPRRLRESAIRPFVYALVPGPTENLLYARVPVPGAAANRSGGSA